jgi:RND family efflux transporter MFP subunit
MEEDPKLYEPKKPGHLFLAGWIIAVIVVIGLTAGLVLARGIHLTHQIEALEDQMALGPHVLVTPVLHGPGSRSIEVPGTIHGFVETPIYAKLAGYLRTINVDKGDQVKQGQIIALLDSPETDQQVENARATYRLAQLTDRRNRSLLRASVIAQQTADETETRMREAKATLDQLLATAKYKEIRAPFDGIVTARYVDAGALIPQSTIPTGTATPIVAMATLTPLRIYADVPQSVAPFIRVGAPASVTVTEYPGRAFGGSVTRHTNALVSETRTMRVEVDIPNIDHALYPGMYAKIDFRVAVPEGMPMVPDDALVFRDGKSYVPIVRNDRLHLAEVTLGYDNGVNVEITNGISADDMVAINVGQAARDGEPVRPMSVPRPN